MLTGKVAIVTGGSRGIGAAIARKLASMGANVALIYAGNQQAAEQVCSQCREYGVVAKAYRCDVSSFDQVKDTVAAVKSDFGTVHILVNNAGITKDGLIAMMKEESFDSVLDTNLKNKRAQHVYERLGFTKLRVNENAWTDQLGEWQSSVDYELYPKDFINFVR